MLSSGNRARFADWLWLLVCVSCSLGWCLSASKELSATFDEPTYLAEGLNRWHTGSYHGLMRLGTMPLPVDVATLPLYAWERWNHVRLDPTTDLEWMLKIARATQAVFWLLLLAYGWLAARQLAGPWAARLAVAWLAFEPNLLAHATLATTDIALAACLMGLLFHFRSGRGGRWLVRVGIPAVWCAAAILAKASGLVFGPLCMLAIEIDRLVRQQALARQGHASDVPGPNLKAGFVSKWRDLLAPFRRDVTHIMLIGLALTFVYCGSDWQPQRSFVEWAHQLPRGPAATGMVWLSEHLAVFTNAGEGLVRQIRHNMRGHGGPFLLGTSLPRAVWYYFPVALTIKLSIPLLLAPLVTTLVGRRSMANWACLAALCLLAFSLTCRVQIGMRMVLPLVVLLVVGVSAAVADAAQRAPQRWRRGVLAWGGAAAVAWTFWSSLAAWPDGLRYINEFWGGSEQGYLLLSDSNYDWGQGVRQLDRWRRKRGIDRLDIWYFGTDPAAAQPPFHNVPLHSLSVGKPDDVLNFAESRYLAVGASLLYGTVHADFLSSHTQAARFLRAKRPVARVDTFLIYDLLPSNPEPVEGGPDRPGRGREQTANRAKAAGGLE